MENILAKEEKIEFCKKEFAKAVEYINQDLNGVDEDRSKYKGLYPFDYKGHVEINKAILDSHIDMLIAHLNYMKEKIRHDEAYLDKR
ncbi:MAG: hypothetical protein MJZ24_08810 [Paludibacteraceae bacterium]|nr:hypothetical protein [Candidatus Physcocola equi]MCQ2234820.1 hypothetical protein [Paludibacteraceae bacterium]